MPTVIFDRSATSFSRDFHPEGPSRLIRTEAHLVEKQPVDFDADTPYYPGIKAHALRAAGAAIESVDLALRGQKGFSLMRPPGHHAASNRAMGFCYLNSIAIAARHAIQVGCERVAIWDFDAHHGNGTEAIVFGDHRIRFASIHQSPCYPGTGTVSRG